MCIKIVKLKEEIPYDTDKPLEEQLRGSRQVVINYEPKDPTIDRFFDEVERLCKNGVSASLNIQFNHNSHIKGAKIKKEINNLAKDLDLNQVIKVIALLQHQTDKILEEMSDICLKR